MKKSAEEILADIDHTLDQLIRNAHLLQQISEKETFASYSAQMHKSQTSLVARLLHMEELLESEPAAARTDPLYEAIQGKLSQYKRLNNQMLNLLSKRFLRARIGRNRKS